MSAKKINPNGLCVKTLRICYQSTAGGGSSTLSVKWPKEGTLLNGRFTIPKTTAFLKTEKESTLSDIMEPHPDEAFYLSDEKVKQLLNKSETL